MFVTEFHDYDAYAHAVKRVDARFMMQKLEKRSWQVGEIGLPHGIRIQLCASGSGLVVQGSGQSGGVLLAIPAAGHFVANGEPVAVDGALHIVAGQEFLVSMPCHHRCFNVFIPDALLQRAGLQAEDGQLERTSTQVLGFDPHCAVSVTALLNRFVASAAAGPEMASSRNALANFELDLINVVRSAYGPQYPLHDKSVGRHPILDKATILSIIEFMDSARNSSIAMSELAARTDISERTLRAGFKKYLGLAPTQYRQLRLLHKARRRLAIGSQEQLTVARVAADLGFYDFGRFAMRYRRAFGELPSETLRRS